VAQRLPTRFDKYIFAEGEKFLLSDIQKQYIQTVLAEEAEKRLALDLDPNNVSSFVQAEAYLKGKIELAQYFLDLSDANFTTSNTGDAQ